MCDPAINLDGKVQPAFHFAARKLPDLVEGIGDEFLAAKARIYAHHQNVIGDVEHFVQRGDRSGRIDDDARLGSFGADHAQRAIQVLTRFLMHQNLIRPRFDERGSVLVGIVDHQVNIEDRLAGLAQRFHHGRANGEVGDEMPVHHVKMEHAAARGFQAGNLFSQPRKIGRENGRKDLNH